MKKGRMGYLVRVVCRPGDGPALARVLAAELGTLGVRSAPYVHRLVAERTVEPVEVTIGSETRTIDVKYGLLDGKVYTCKPCLLYTSPSPRDGLLSRMPSSA